MVLPASHDSMEEADLALLVRGVIDIVFRVICAVSNLNFVVCKSISLLAI